MALLEPFHLTAVNLAKASENKMHDDAVARTYGFEGGLVPGVAVFGYLSHPAVTQWGRAFLERGLIEAKFLKPVYDGDSVAVTAEESDGGIDIEVKARGTTCATGRAALPEAPATVASADIEFKGHRLGTVELRYSDSCRTAWARLHNDSGHEPGDAHNGFADVVRDSDGLTYSCSSPTRDNTTCWTKMVDDAGSTIHAYGNIDPFPARGHGNADALTDSY